MMRPGQDGGRAVRFSRARSPADNIVDALLLESCCRQFRCGVNPNCNAFDSQESHPFADKIGRINSYTADRLTDSPDPPASYGMIQFEDGGRWMMDFTDLGSRAAHRSCDRRVADGDVAAFDRRESPRRYKSVLLPHPDGPARRRTRPAVLSARCHRARAPAVPLLASRISIPRQGHGELASCPESRVKRRSTACYLGRYHL
jgi:hypothetical protein